ncbi:MAG: GntR family transcriptional regulator [Zoogloeaceae bacterium]|jgi:GntR family transcriptional regulator|nr:GntR family transcriptional regulator [Zoogloeaceae bacterium]
MPENPIVFRHSSLPLYAQIKETLREQIIEGGYREHERIPSESELMNHYGVSRITVRQALSDLENEQLIFKIPGKGSFVARPRPFQHSTRLQGFGEAMLNLGITVTNRVVSMITIQADALVAKRLQVAEGSPLMEFRRIRHANGNVISLDVTYVRRTLGERLAREDLVRRDIFLILENDYSIPLGHADLKIDAIAADAMLAKLLDIAVGAPVLRTERLTWSRSGEPIDFEYLYYPGDSFHFQLRAERE